MKNGNLLLILFYLLFPVSLIYWTSFLWVPLFLCLLGNCFFIKNDLSINELIKNRILRYLFSFVLLFLIQFLLIYFLIDCDSLGYAYNKLLEHSHFVMFYHYIIMFFMFYPLFKNVSKDYKMCKYLIIIFFCFASLPTVLNKVPVISYINYFLLKFNGGYWFDTHCLYLFMFYYLCSVDVKKKYRYLFYTITLFISPIIIYFSINSESFYELLLEVNSPYIVYITFVICLLSKYEFGFLKTIKIPIFFAYPLICGTVYVFLKEYLNFNAVVMVILTTVLPYLICCFLSKYKSLKKLVIFYDDEEDYEE